MIDGEYIDVATGLIFCERCKKTRQSKMWYDGECYLIPMQCECQREMVRQKELAEKRVKAAEMREKAMLKKKYKEYRLERDDGRSPEIVQQIKAYVSQFAKHKKLGRGLLLWGNVGTGKTFYAMCVANALIDELEYVKIITLQEVIEQAQDFKKREAYFNRLLLNDVIVIDDLGIEKDSEFGVTQIYKFINECYVQNIPLIITTNLTPNILRELSNDTSNITLARIFSRVLAMCCPIKVNGINRRELDMERLKKEMKKELTGSS